MRSKRSNSQPVQYVPFSRPPGGIGAGGCFIRFSLGLFFLLVLVLVGGALVGGTVLYADWTKELNDSVTALDDVPERQIFETSRILDRKGNVLWEIFGEGRRTRVPLDQIPGDMIQATISVEDDTFYQNAGVDIPSLLGAVYGVVRDPSGRPAGGSTITQQLVRHLVFDYEERTAVSIDRKVKEIILAWIMDRNYSKDEILEMYLNEVNFGNLAYGIEAAANVYFGKSATDLSLAEASLLAALPQSPYGLDPYNNLEAAKARQWLVLNLMVGEGYISRLDAEVAYQKPLQFEWQDVSLEAPHFSVYVRQQLEEMFGPEMVAEGGLQVTTTLDLDYQRLAEQLTREQVAALGPDHDMGNAALVALKPSTGEIIAMLGSVDYDNDEINGRVNITLTPQQPGSTIKPFIYAAALTPDERGETDWTPADILWDVEVDYGLDPQGPAYSPVNYDQKFRGPVRLRSALANSYNVPAILLLQDVGVANLMSFANKLGITTWQQNPQDYGLSLALGSAEVTPLELTTAYAAFANGGYRVSPVSILRVVGKDGSVLYEHESATREPVLDERVAFLISDILDDDPARTPTLGGDNPLVLPFPAAAKMGTTADNRDVWTVGYTPGLVVGVWAGNSDNSPMRDIDGSTGAAPLWAAFMRTVYDNPEMQRTLAYDGELPPVEFVRPDGVSRRLLCALSSVTPGASDCRVNQSEWFLDTPESDDEFEPDGKVVWEEIDPAVVRVPALRLAETERQNAGTQSSASSQYCRYDEGLDYSRLPENTLSQIFLVPPRNVESVVEAALWAQSNGLVVLPARPCSGDLEVLAGLDADAQNLATIWRIASPQSGQLVSGTVNISGTANFQANTQGYYQVELGIPATDGSETRWVALGGRRSSPVVNGQLAVLDTSTLVPGDYFLRLSVTQNGRSQGDPYIVSFRVGGTQAAQAPADRASADQAGQVVDVADVVNPPQPQAPEPQPQPQPQPQQPEPPAQDEDNCASLSGCD
ncbi:MAG: transglycosylase domain-containing protein [Candidatus Promineifilaceae bacterium]